MTKGLRGIVADIENNALQNRHIGMAVILVFSLAVLISERLEDIYIFGWMAHGRYSFFTGVEIRGYYLYSMGTLALLLLSFDKICAACGVTMGNAVGLIAGHFLGERHYAAQVAKITPDMDEGTVGAILCCAQNGVFIWLQIVLLFFAAGLLADWFLQRRAGKTVPVPLE